MAVPLLPDVTQLAIDALLAQSPVTALVGTRIYPRIPDTPTWPLLRVSVVDEIERQWHTGLARVQVDCWGAGNTLTDEQQARTIARTLVSVHRDLRGAYASGRISNTGLGAVVPAPDPDNGRPRFVVDLLLHVHPA